MVGAGGRSVHGASAGAFAQDDRYDDRYDRTTVATMTATTTVYDYAKVVDVQPLTHARACQHAAA